MSSLTCKDCPEGKTSESGAASCHGAPTAAPTAAPSSTSSSVLPIVGGVAVLALLGTMAFMGKKASKKEEADVVKENEIL